MKFVSICFIIIFSCNNEPEYSYILTPKEAILSIDSTGKYSDAFINQLKRNLKDKYELRDSVLLKNDTTYTLHPKVTGKNLAVGGLGTVNNRHSMHGIYFTLLNRTSIKFEYSFTDWVNRFEINDTAELRLNSVLTDSFKIANSSINQSEFVYDLNNEKYNATIIISKQISSNYGFRFITGKRRVKNKWIKMPEGVMYSK